MDKILKIVHLVLFLALIFTAGVFSRFIIQAGENNTAQKELAVQRQLTSQFIGDLQKLNDEKVNVVLKNYLPK
jgi:hypothetical protein